MLGNNGNYSYETLYHNNQKKYLTLTHSSNIQFILKIFHFSISISFKKIQNPIKLKTLPLVVKSPYLEELSSPFLMPFMMLALKK